MWAKVVEIIWINNGKPFIFKHLGQICELVFGGKKRRLKYPAKFFSYLSFFSSQNTYITHWR